jgi:hypothetical protein
MHQPSRTVCMPISATKSATNGLMHRSKKALFDHLVGASKYRGRNLEAERLGCLEVDDQLEFGGLFGGEVGGFGTFEDPLTHTGSN